MRVLAIDTSCAAASVAVYDAVERRALAAETRPMAQGHAEALGPMVQSAMAQVEGGFPTIDRIAVCVGPGSFTGIRISIAMARAMGVALGAPVVGVSSLIAFAGPLLADPRPGVIVVGRRRPARPDLFPALRGYRPPAVCAAGRQAQGRHPADGRRPRAPVRQRSSADRRRDPAAARRFRCFAGLALPRHCRDRARRAGARSGDVAGARSLHKAPGRAASSGGNDSARGGMTRVVLGETGGLAVGAAAK